jgi:putative membrane protein
MYMACFLRWFWQLFNQTNLFMMKSTLKLMFFATALAFASCGDTPDDSKEVAEEQNEQKFDDTKMEGDSEFAVSAANLGMSEVEFSKLAAANATNGTVKEFANMMVTDHTAVNEELKSAAASKNITLPTSLSEGKQESLTKLSEKKGADFDKDYMDAMVSDHKDAIDLFQKEANDGKDADLKAWAAGKIATLQAHHDKAKAIRDAIK